MGDKPQFIKLIGVYERDSSTETDRAETVAVLLANFAHGTWPFLLCAESNSSHTCFT